MAGPTVYTAEVTGPLGLAGFDTEEVNFTCDAGFGLGALEVREVMQSVDFDCVTASIRLKTLHHRLGTRAQQRQTEPRANLTKAILAGAKAIREPWESLPEAERVEFVKDFASLAAARAIEAALPLLGLDEDGGLLP